MRMRLITKNTDYAVRALCFMARQKDEIMAVTELARKLHIPRPFLRKILQILNKRGLLRSYRGQAGGFMLARPPDSIFLTELIEIFQGPVKLNDCILKKGLCYNIRTCLLKSKIDDVEKRVIRELESITVKSLLN